MRYAIIQDRRSDTDSGGGMSAFKQEDADLLSLAFISLCRSNDEEFTDLASRFGGLWASMPWPSSDDPIDDYSRLMAIFLAVAVSRGVGYAKPGPVDKNLKFVDQLARRSSQTFPGFWDENRWRILLQACLGPRYGGTRVRIKKLPARQKREDARTMTVKQLKWEHGICWSYAYKLASRKK